MNSHKLFNMRACAKLVANHQSSYSSPSSVSSALSLMSRRWASTEQQDLVVIGSGPGGYVAAIKAAQLGLKVSGRGSLP